MLSLQEQAELLISIKNAVGQPSEKDNENMLRFMIPSLTDENFKRGITTDEDQLHLWATVFHISNFPEKLAKCILMMMLGLDNKPFFEKESLVGKISEIQTRCKRIEEITCITLNPTKTFDKDAFIKLLDNLGKSNPTYQTLRIVTDIKNILTLLMENIDDITDDQIEWAKEEIYRDKFFSNCSRFIDNCKFVSNVDIDDYLFPRE